MKPRRPRSDSVTALVSAAQAGKARALAVPAHLSLSTSALTYWPAIIEARNRDEWTDLDLVLAAHLAQCQADLEVEAATLVQEGTVIAGKANPRCAVVDLLSRRQMALMRTLRIGGLAAGRQAPLEPARQLQREVSSRLKEIFDDDPDELLAH